MMLSLEIPPDVERELNREAEAQGVAVPALAIRLLQEAVVLPAAKATEATRRSPAEIRAWLDSLAEFTDRMPARPGETFSRSMIYQDHD
jgi:hypothetical protein